MDSNQSGEELVKMSYVNLKTEVTLTEEEQQCGEQPEPELSHEVGRLGRDRV